jgi:hypothetical protein
MDFIKILGLSRLRAEGYIMSIRQGMLFYVNQQKCLTGKLTQWPIA